MSTNRRPRISIGASSILMIFVILCLTTFSVLSFVTANADYKLTEKSFQTVSSYYQADAQAQETLAAIDSVLVNLAETAGGLADSPSRLADWEETPALQEQLRAILNQTDMTLEQQEQALYCLLVRNHPFDETIQTDYANQAEDAEEFGRLAFVLPAGNQRQLEVALELKKNPWQNRSGRYRVSVYQVVSTVDWEDDFPDLWEGPQGGNQKTE